MNLPSWKRLVIALPLLVLWGCSQETNTEKGASAPEAAQVSGAESEGTVTPTSYTEYLQCQFGQNYSPEAFQPFLADWNQEISQLPDRGLRAFGYMPRDWSSEAFDGIWVLR